MAQAIMDPEEVRRFAKELKRFNDDVQMKAQSLQARFAALGSTWQDQEAEKFAEEFITTMKVMKKFVEISEKHNALPPAQGPAHRGIPQPALAHGGAGKDQRPSEALENFPRGAPSSSSRTRIAAWMRWAMPSARRGSGFSTISGCTGRPAAQMAAEARSSDAGADERAALEPARFDDDAGECGAQGEGGADRRLEEKLRALKQWGRQLTTTRSIR
jgi:uncharacterized protein YukE